MSEAIRHVSLDVQNQLFAELESAMKSFPAERSLTWRGENARCGPLRISGDVSARSKVSSTQSALPKSSIPSPSEQDPETESYWTELRKSGGSEAAVCVQRWLMRYVEGLSLDEIELLATPSKSAL